MENAKQLSHQQIDDEYNIIYSMYRERLIELPKHSYHVLYKSDFEITEWFMYFILLI